MPEYATRYNAAQLLARLRDRGLAENDREPAAFILGRRRPRGPPLHIQLVAGIGAFTAASFFISFLEATGLIDFDFEAGLIAWGMVFTAGAIGLHRWRMAGPGDTMRHAFLAQFSFACMAAGKILFVIGVSTKLDWRGWEISIAILLISIAAYHLYPVAADRFLSSFAVLVAVTLNLLHDSAISASRELLFDGFFLFQVAAAAVLLTHGRLGRDCLPPAQACVFSLCAVLLLLASEAGDIYGEGQAIRPAFMNAVLSGALIALIGWAAGGIRKLGSEPLLFASLGALLLGVVSVPGVMLAIGMMVLGYARHEKLLIVSGALFLPLFLFLYYSALDVSLAQKSAILAASGLVLLAGRLCLKLKGWDRGGTSCEPSA